MEVRKIIGTQLSLKGICDRSLEATHDWVISCSEFLVGHFISLTSPWDGFWNGDINIDRITEVSLKLTAATSHQKSGQAPKRNDRIPTIHFQVGTTPQEKLNHKFKPFM